jgi:hypothetical protein
MCLSLYHLCACIPRRELESHLIPDLANIASEYVLGPHQRGSKLSAKGKRVVFGVSASDLRKAQHWYIACAREVHEWPLVVHNMDHGWHPHWDSDALPPFDEHPYHSSADEAECSRKRQRHPHGVGLSDDDQSSDGKREDEEEQQAADDGEEANEADAIAAVDGTPEDVPASVAAAAAVSGAPLLDPVAPMELDD